MPFGIQVHSLIFWYEYVQEWYDMHAYVTSYGPQVDYKCIQITLRDFMSAYVMSRHVLCETQKCHVGGVCQTIYLGRNCRFLVSNRFLN